MKVKKLSNGKCYNLCQYKGFKVIEMTRLAAFAIGFGMMQDDANYICLDCRTNENIIGNIIYIPVLNDCMTIDTFSNWVANATHYSEDGVVEYNNTKRIVEMLKNFDNMRNSKLHSQFEFIE